MGVAVGHQIGIAVAVEAAHAAVGAALDADPVPQIFIAQKDPQDPEGAGGRPAGRQIPARPADELDLTGRRETLVFPGENGRKALCRRGVSPGRVELRRQFRDRGQDLLHVLFTGSAVKGQIVAPENGCRHLLQ